MIYNVFGDSFLQSVRLGFYRMLWDAIDKPEVRRLESPAIQLDT